MKINAPQFGDLKTFTVSINSHDITESVVQVSIFQDLLTPFPSCQIDVIDTVNMITKYNLAANANVNIKLGTTQGHDTDSEKSLNFVIHDIGNKVQQNHKAFSYTILCAPREFVNNQNAKVCKSFPQNRPDEIVKSVSEFLNLNQRSSGSEKLKYSGLESLYVVDKIKSLYQNIIENA